MGSNGIKKTNKQTKTTINNKKTHTLLWGCLNHLSFCCFVVVVFLISQRIDYKIQVFVGFFFFLNSFSSKHFHFLSSFNPPPPHTHTVISQSQWNFLLQSHTDSSMLKIVLQLLSVLPRLRALVYPPNHQVGPGLSILTPLKSCFPHASLHITQALIAFSNSVNIP